MARMALIEAHGGPEMIQWHDVTLPAPDQGEVRIKQSAVGLNFIDTYHRRGIYPIDLPGGLGIEAAGIVTALGDNVAGLSVGDRVATFGPARNAYADERNVPAASLFKLPDEIPDDVAAAALLKGCTAEFLIERCAKVQPGWTGLVHAAAGGVGLILVQWLKAIGATVIGTVSTQTKAAEAMAAGADHIIFYQTEDIAARVREITGGKGASVVFDGIGMATWNASLAATARRGMIVNYGNVGAPVTGIGLGALAAGGSLFVSRPTLFDYYVTAEERVAGVERLWSMIRSSQVKIAIGQRYALEDVAQAHSDLEAGKTTGSTVLVP